jgi:AcrR family transcriptional regulator
MTALPDGRHARRPFSDDAADDTRQAILAAGHQIFCERAYSDVSGLQISKAAGVTRGGLQYHFDSKQGLFLAVFERLQHQVVERVRAAIAEHADPVEQARAGIAAFLDACAEHDYQAVVLKGGACCDRLAALPGAG